MVRVPVWDGLRQVVDGHLVFPARLYHKVAKGKAPLKRREEGSVGQVTCRASCTASPKAMPPPPQKFSETEGVTITTRSQIRGSCIWGLSPLVLPAYSNHLDPTQETWG